MKLSEEMITGWGHIRIGFCLRKVINYVKRRVELERMKNNPERKESASAANGTAHLRIQGKPSVAEGKMQEQASWNMRLEKEEVISKGRASA